MLSRNLIQRFIEIGDGYSDLYELMEIAKTNRHRLVALLSLETIINNKKVTSAAVILDPVQPSNFQPLYICLEGIPKDSKRYELFVALASTLNTQLFRLEVKPSNEFNEKELYYQYIIGVLRMNKMIKNL